MFKRKVPSANLRTNESKNKVSLVSNDSQSFSPPECDLGGPSGHVPLAPESEVATKKFKTVHKGIVFRVGSKKGDDQSDNDSDNDNLFTVKTDASFSNTDHQRVFATAGVDTDVSQDHRAMLERNIEIGKKLLSGELESGIYRGKGAIRPAIEIREGAVSGAKYSGLYGPLRGSQYARTTMRIDYNPEICKDYKETGYCGYGDTCKFLHDRSDYKSGWQLEKEWEAKQKRRQEKLLKQGMEQKNKASRNSNSSSSSNEDS